MVIINRLRFTFIYIFTVCFPISTCTKIRYPVCSFEVQINSRTCSKGNVLSLNCRSDLINITHVYDVKHQRTCDEGKACEKCCHPLNELSERYKKSVADICDKKSNCRITPSHSENSYNIYYQCMSKLSNQPSTTIIKTSKTKPISTTTIIASSAKTTLIKTSQVKTTLTQTISAAKTTTTNTQKITRSNTFSTAALAVALTIVFVLIVAVIAVVCFVKTRRQKKEEAQGNNGQITSKTAKLVSSCVYTGDISDDVVIKPSRSVKTIISSIEDSVYAECQDVETIDTDNGEYNTIETDADNGEYNTIEINQPTQSVDPAYSHLLNQINIVDNTYSHITTEQINPPDVSDYSHLNVESVHSKTGDNDATYNTLQTHDVNPAQKRQPANFNESESVYNIANFASDSAKHDQDDTEYSHLNTNIKSKTNVISTENKLILNDVDYVEVDNPHHDINADNTHTYFVLEKGGTGAKK